jgi:hypothetical protein
MRVSQEAFPELMKRVLALKKEAEFSMHEKTTFLLFMIHCFQSLEDVMVRAVMLPLVSLPLWRNLSPGRLQLELRATPALEKHWKNLAKKDAKVCVVDLVDACAPLPPGRLRCPPVSQLTRATPPQRRLPSCQTTHRPRRAQRRGSSPRCATSSSA